MKTLLDERWAPITSSIGFLELPLDSVAEGLVTWNERLYPRVSAFFLEGGLGELLPHLEPLTVGARPRELLIAVDKWTAFFDNSFRGTDALSAVTYLAARLECRGLVATSAPHTIGMRDVLGQRAGQVKFELLAPFPTDFLNFARTVGVTWDGNRWVFESYGTELSFEEAAAYCARRVRDRFTSDMLERYCRSLGVDVFNEDAYGPQAVLVESAVPLPLEARSLSVAEAQRLLGIEPKSAKRLSG